MDNEYFHLIDSLLRSGRFQEAAQELQRWARAGAPSAEIYIWKGRIAERMALLEDAERAFRKAISADRISALPRVELARFLDETGRPGEAREVLRGITDEAMRKLASMADGMRQGTATDIDVGDFFSLMEIGLFRKVFMAELEGKDQDLKRVEAMLRTVLRADPQRAPARTLLVEVLIMMGKLRASERELIRVLLPRLRGVETSRCGALLRLIDHGRYGRSIERALLGYIHGAERTDNVMTQWPNIFSALMCTHRYHAAFQLSEAMLDKLGKLEMPQAFLWPWRRKVPRGVAEGRLCAEELKRLQGAGSDGAFPHWFAYCRAILLSASGEQQKAMAEYKHIRSLDAARYAWMRQPFLLMMLTSGEGDWEEIVGSCQEILRHSPGHWWIQCRLAEAYLVRGDWAQGLREFARAQSATTDASAKREVLTWHGEVLLWLGQYRKALAKLDEAVGLGAKTFVYGWRGAAYLKLGDYHRALADFDRAIELDPKDFEARIWRGEAYRLLGRYQDALQALDDAILCESGNCWGYFNRALVRGALGDVEGMADDFSAIPSDVTAFLRAKLGIPEGRALSPAEMRKVLTTGLKSARGIRRTENYLKRIWMGS